MQVAQAQREGLWGLLDIWTEDAFFLFSAFGLSNTDQAMATITRWPSVFVEWSYNTTLSSLSTCKCIVKKYTTQLDWHSGDTAGTTLTSYTPYLESLGSSLGSWRLPCPLHVRGISHFFCMLPRVWYLSSCFNVSWAVQWAWRQHRSLQIGQGNKEFLVQRKRTEQSWQRASSSQQTAAFSRLLILRCWWSAIFDKSGSTISRAFVSALFAWASQNQTSLILSRPPCCCEESSSMPVPIMYQGSIVMQQACISFDMSLPAELPAWVMFHWCDTISGGYSLSNPDPSVLHVWQASRGAVNCAVEF